MRLRASVRQQSKQKRTRERTAAGRGMSGNYLEPDRDGYDDSEDEGAISLAAIKNKFKRGGGRTNLAFIGVTKVHLESQGNRLSEDFSMINE